MGGEGLVIRFVDSEYNALFTVADGDNIVLTSLDGSQSVCPCRYVDDYHAMIGGQLYHINQFAVVQEQMGAVYAPEHPQKGDVCDTYEIFQLKDPRGASYGFCSYDEARDKLRPAHYQKVFAGVFPPKATLDDLFLKHNTDHRPRRMEMRSLSVSDIVVLNRGGKKQAFYVDSIGFQEVEQFLKPRQRGRKRPAPER